MISSADDETLEEMDEGCEKRLSNAELHAMFDTMFPQGFAGPDVLSELAPEGWRRSPLVSCFHPSVEQRHLEAVRIHRNMAMLRAARRHKQSADAPSSEPTPEEIRDAIQPAKLRPREELTELVGLCLWDVFSDNHEVIAADGRVADIGSFRGAGAFLDEYLSGFSDGDREGDYLRFYLGTIWIASRADLTPVYAMIFRRLKAAGADWIYSFPKIHLVSLCVGTEDGPRTPYSPNEALAAERARHDRALRVARLRADLDEGEARAREEALDQPPPATISGYRLVYGTCPRGWPPA